MPARSSMAGWRAHREEQPALAMPTRWPMPALAMPGDARGHGQGFEPPGAAHETWRCWRSGG